MIESSVNTSKEVVKLKREKERLQEVMQSKDFMLYSKDQRVSIVRRFNQKCKRIIELEEKIGGNYAI